MFIEFFSFFFTVKPLNVNLRQDPHADYVAEGSDLTLFCEVDGQVDIEQYTLKYFRYYKHPNRVHYTNRQYSHCYTSECKVRNVKYTYSYYCKISFDSETSFRVKGETITTESQWKRIGIHSKLNAFTFTLQHKPRYPSSNRFL